MILAGVHDIRAFLLIFHSHREISSAKLMQNKLSTMPF
jgi:hypothetical protein